MANSSATVVALTAEVRALMIGSRQVTLSVYRQLDTVDHTECEPFGRVRDPQNVEGYGVYVVGRHVQTGSLVRSYRKKAPHKLVVVAPDVMYDWIRNGSRPFERTRNYSEIPILEDSDITIWASFYRMAVDHRGWEYVDPEQESQAVDLVRGQLDEALLIKHQYEEWAQLPLIVLAGLR
jgi:hypothetical protein